MASGRLIASPVARALRELIPALDRRLPRPERPGETRIAGEALTLRQNAVSQLASLRVTEPGDAVSDQEHVDAAMTDDGCPSADSDATARS
mgnify:CR=1 FL=1